MPEFAIFFRPGSRPLTDDELARRAAAVRAWVTDANRRGVLDHPHLLDEAGVVVAADRSATPIAREGALATVLIVRAADLDAAVAVARSHPGFDFGSTAEVRPLRPQVLVPPR